MLKDLARNYQIKLLIERSLRKVGNSDIESRLSEFFDVRKKIYSEARRCCIRYMAMKPVRTLGCSEKVFHHSDVEHVPAARQVAQIDDAIKNETILPGGSNL